MGDAARKALSLKQRRFIEEYAASDGNAVQAYFRAFGRYTGKGKRRTYKGARNQASVLLANPNIQEELKAANDEYARRVRVSKVKVLREVAALAFADPDDVYEPDDTCGGLPAPKKWRDIPATARKAIQSVKIKRRRLRDGKESTEWEVEELEYRFHSKTDALDKLCKKLGFYASEGDTGDKGTDAGRAAELAALLNALFAARKSSGGAGGGTGVALPGDGVVGAERGPAGASVYQPG